MKKVIGKKSTGNSFKRDDSSSFSSALGKGFKTGDETLDLAIQHHEELIKSIKKILDAMREKLKHLKTTSETSSKLTRYLAKFYYDTPEQGRLVGYQDAHERLDIKLPETMIMTAVTHIIHPLEEFLKKLEDATGEIKEFKQVHDSHDHYQKKVAKLREEQRKRQQDNKQEKPKQGDKLTRNVKKLEESEARYKPLSEALVNRLMFLNDSRLDSMNPIFVKIVQFEQEYFKSCHNIISAYDMKASARPTADPNRRPSASALGAFDSQGNRVSESSQGHPSTSQVGLTSAHHFGSSSSQHFGPASSQAPQVPSERPVSRDQPTPPPRQSAAIASTNFNPSSATASSTNFNSSSATASSTNFNSSSATASSTNFDPFSNLDMLLPTPTSTAQGNSSSQVAAHQAIGPAGLTNGHARQQQVQSTAQGQGRQLAYPPNQAPIQQPFPPTNSSGNQVNFQSQQVAQPFQHSQSFQTANPFESRRQSTGESNQQPGTQTFGDMNQAGFQNQQAGESNQQFHSYRTENQFGFQNQNLGQTGQATQNKGFQGFQSNASSQLASQAQGMSLQQGSSHHSNVNQQPLGNPSHYTGHQGTASTQVQSQGYNAAATFNNSTTASHVYGEPGPSQQQRTGTQPISRTQKQESDQLVDKWFA